MIVHLADEHAKLHDLYVENHKKSIRELLEAIKEHDQEESQINKVEKANKIAKQNVNSEDDKPQITLSFNGRKRKQSYDEDEKTTREHEKFNNSNSTLREYFVPLGMLYAKCKSCHSTVSVQVSQFISSYL